MLMILLPYVLTGLNYSTALSLSFNGEVDPPGERASRAGKVSEFFGGETAVPGDLPTQELIIARYPEVKATPPRRPARPLAV